MSDDIFSPFLLIWLVLNIVINETYIYIIEIFIYSLKIGKIRSLGKIGSLNVMRLR